MPSNRRLTEIPGNVQEWLDDIQSDNNISQAVKSGREPLHVAHTDYQSGSGLRRTEYLHLRSFWVFHPDSLNDFDKMMRDDPKTKYTGYVSPANHERAARICDNPTQALKRYYQEVAANGDGLAPDPQCGLWAFVRLWQALAVWHTKSSSSATSGDDGEASKIVKHGYAYNPSVNTLANTYQNMALSTPPPKAKRADPIHGTPAAIGYEMASTPRANPQSVDEMYANVSLLLLLQATISESIIELGSLIWVPPRLSLKLLALPAPSIKSTSGVRPAAKELLEAQVDGYLCRRSATNEFVPVPLAICETKPFVRSRKRPQVFRQETAEMAAWIASHGGQSNGSDGLLQSSTSGRMRRLLISQDRHEIYIIIGEYGASYEDYITGRTALPACAEKLPAATASAFDVTGNLRGSLGSASYVRRVEATGMTVAGLDTLSRPAPPLPSGMFTRSRPAPPAVKLPPADEFLVMHQYGPYLITKADNMERLVRRLIALMLQLRSGAAEPVSVFTPQPPPASFVEQGMPRSWPRRQQNTMQEYENYSRQ